MRKTAPALELHFVASRQARFFLRMGLVTAAVCCVMLPLAWAVAALSILLAYGFYLWRQPQRAGEMRLSDTQCVLTHRGAPPRILNVLPGTWVTEHLVVVQGRDAETQRFVTQLIWADSLSADDHRRLRAHLRWRAQT